MNARKRKSFLARLLRVAMLRREARLSRAANLFIKPLFKGKSIHGIAALESRATLLFLAVAFLLTSCSSHYRQSLDDYRADAPTPFAARTLEWIGAADPATTGSVRTALPAQFEFSHPDADAEPARIVAGLFGAGDDEIAAALARFTEDADLEAALGDGVTYKELALAVAARNPEVRAARERWAATARQYDQAEYLENLIAEYRAFTRYLDVQAGNSMQRGMTQAFFPYPGAIALKGEVVRAGVRMAALEWQRMLRETVIEAGERFFQWQYLRRAEATAQENVELLESLLAVVEERYRVGSASQSDLLKLQTELERQRNLERDVRAEQRAAVALINALIARRADAPLGPPGDANLPTRDWDLAGMMEVSRQCRQEILEQQARVDQMESNIRMGEVMNRPPATQGYSLLERGMEAEASADAAREPFGVMNKTVDRPLFAQSESYLMEMRQRARAERSQLEQVLAQTEGMAQEWLQNLDVARRQARLVEEIVLPQSQSAYATVQSAYVSGGATFLDLLDAERELIMARLEIDAARRDLNQVLNRLPRVTGRLDGVAVPRIRSNGGKSMTGSD